MTQPNVYDSCPHCRESFSFAPPVDNVCKWCGKALTQPTQSRPYRYDGLDEYGQHWGEYLGENGEPTEEYFLLPGPMLAEAVKLIQDLSERLSYYPGNGGDPYAIRDARNFLARIQAHQPESEAWFNVGAGEQVDNSAECE